MPVLGIRARLIVLSLLIMVPLVFERVHGLENARAERNEQARQLAMDLAQRGTQSQREIIYAVRALLQVVARSYAKVPFEGAECDKYLTSLKGNVVWLRGLSIAKPNGQIGCSSEPTTVGLNVSDRPHFQNALHAKDFALSDYLVNRTHQLPTIIATFPVLGEDGSASAVVLAAINLQWLGELVETVTRRSGATVLLLDGSGTLIAASADQEKLIGKPFAGQDLTKNMLANDEGTETARAFDGVARIFAYARVPWTQARLAVGLDERTVQADIDHELAMAYLQLVLFGIFVLMIAWFGGEQLVVRPIRSLVRTATLFGRGDLHIRATNDSWLPEFQPLAAALDDMALKLAGREEELQIANDHLEELASLDSLTGLSNRRGFDRRLETEWKQATEQHQPVALMMIDIDHFKLYNDRYGHVAGDTCLRAVAEALSLVTLDNNVLVTRYGGEEFALLLPGLSLEAVSALGEDVRRSIEDLSITHAEAPCGHLTVSVGVESIVPEGRQTTGEFIEAADRALYAAKRAGRDRVVANRPVIVPLFELEAPVDYELPPSLVA